MTNLRKFNFTAVCIALCVVLPIAFHAIPNAGSIFLPMHIPVLLCGLTCGWLYGLVCGLLGPLLSSVFTGMPAMAYLPSMLVELAIYGVVSGLMMRWIHTKKLYPDLYISLISAMLVGRVAAGAVKALIFTPGQITVSAWMASYFVTAWPGIVIQLILIPAIVVALEKAKLIPKRYPEEAKLPQG